MIHFLLNSQSCLINLVFLQNFDIPKNVITLPHSAFLVSESLSKSTFDLWISRRLYECVSFLGQSITLVILMFIYLRINFPFLAESFITMMAFKYTIYGYSCVSSKLLHSQKIDLIAA